MCCVMNQATARHRSRREIEIMIAAAAELVLPLGPARSIGPMKHVEELNRRGFAFYEAFRPDIPAGARGWGATGELDLDRITSLARSEP